MRYLALATLLLLVPLPGDAFQVRAQFQGQGSQGMIAPSAPAAPLPRAIPGARPQGFFRGTPFPVAPPVFVNPEPFYDPISVPMYVPPAPAAPSLPPMTRVIEYPEGRYELRGDGLTLPFVWVWVPNPPSAPPAAAVPVPPAAPPPPQEPPVAPTGPRTPSVIYQWVDDQGVVHWTDDRQRVPERFRSKVIRFEDGRPSS